MPRILLVDDDIAEISAVKRVLARAGHQPALATNASDAQVAVDHERPDLLLVSSTCEGGDALGLARQLAGDPATAGIPLVVLGDAPSLPESARRLGRPIDPELLADEVNAALAGAGTALPGPATSPASPGQPPFPLPGRRPAHSDLQDAAATRRAAAEALRARAEELRRSTPHGPGWPAPAPTRATAAPAAPPAPRSRPSMSAPFLLPPLPERAFVMAPPAASPPPAAAPPPPPPAPDLEDDAPEAAFGNAGAASGGEDDGELPTLILGPENEDPRHLAADEALRALEAEAAVEPDRQAEERALREAVETARREAVEMARRDAFEAARRELEERARREADEAARRLQEEARARREEVEELSRREADEIRLRGEAEAQARAEVEARQHAEDELVTLRAEREAERREAERQLAAVKERAAAEGQAAEELRRMAEEELRRRDEAAEAHGAEEKQLRAAIASARAELDAVRQQASEEARRRAEAEEALRKLADASRREAERREQEEREAEAREAERLEAERREAEAREAERLEAERREAERLAAGRLEAEAREAERRDAEEREAKKLEEGRREAERLEADRREAEARQAEGRGAERREAAAAAAPAAPAAGAYEPPSFLGPFEAPDRATAEEAARRRVAALRSPPAEPDAPAEPARAPAGAAYPGEAEAVDLSDLGEPPEAEEAARVWVQPPAQLRAGNLAELPAPRLLAQAARARVSGRYDLEGEVARSIWLENGLVVGASSADPSERLEEVALRLGLLTRDQHRQIAQAAAALPARRAALLLLERGFLKPTELTGLVRRRTEEVVFGIFAEPEAVFRWMAVAVPPEERIALSRGTLALVVEGVRRRWLAPRVDALLGGPGTLLVPVVGAPPAAELGLSPEERRVVALADGLRTLDEITQASPLDPLSTRQALAGLVLCGALGVRLLQAGRPSGRAAAAIDLARVKDKLDQVRRADYFTVLGVGRLCTPHEVREAADRLRTEFDPRRFSEVGDDGLPARLSEILQVVEDARSVLADDRLRDEYLRGLA